MLNQKLIKSSNDYNLFMFDKILETILTCEERRLLKGDCCKIRNLEDCAIEMNKLGYRTKQGKPITYDNLRNYAKRSKKILGDDFMLKLVDLNYYYDNPQQVAKVKSESIAFRTSIKTKYDSAVKINEEELLRNKIDKQIKEMIEKEYDGELTVEEKQYFDSVLGVN